jgi:asparagine synthase (glutamine-hydrolysing)
MNSAEFRYRVLGLAADGFDMAHTMRSWFPIETREATTDLRVLEFCMSIPGDQYLRGGRDRLLIRRAMRGIVPASILDRTTRGAQAADWSVWFNDMKPAIEAELRILRGVDLACRCLDLHRMQKLVDEWPARLGPEHLGDYGMLLLRGLMMGRFIRWFEERWG